MTSAPAPDTTELARLRTAYALDRTLLAWIRTGLAFIAFGFTLGSLLRTAVDKGWLDLRPHAPRNLGLTMIGLGLAGLIAGMIEHRRATRALGLPKGAASLAPQSLAFGLVVFGILLAIGLHLRLGPY